MLLGFVAVVSLAQAAEGSAACRSGEHAWAKPSLCPEDVSGP